MKKNDIILILVVLLLVVGAYFLSSSKKEDEIKFPVTLTGEVGLNQIDYAKYKEMIDNDETFVVIIERAGCSYCEMFMPIVKEYAEEKKIAITYIDTDTLSEEEFNDLSTSNSYLKRNRWGTPTTLFMRGSKVIDYLDGYREKEQVDEFFKERVVMGE